MKQHRIQKEKTAQKRSDDTTEASQDAPATKNVDVDGLKDEMDTLLDAIDEVLEENAEDFVKSYVQRGGE